MLATMYNSGQPLTRRPRNERIQQGPGLRSASPAQDDGNLGLLQSSRGVSSLETVPESHGAVQ